MPTSLIVRPITGQQHLSFVAAANGSFLQTPAWGAVKSDWRHESHHDLGAVNAQIEKMSAQVSAPVIAAVDPGSAVDFPRVARNAARPAADRLGPDDRQGGSADPRGGASSDSAKKRTNPYF